MCDEERIAELIVKILSRDSKLSFGNKVFIVKHILLAMNYTED